MSVTGTQVASQLQSIFTDASDERFTSTQKLAAINAAIYASYPRVAKVAVDSSITLATTTFEYTPTATDVPVETGFAAAYVTPESITSEPKIRLGRSVRQRQAGTTWTIIVHPNITAGYNGNVLHLEYNARIAPITALGDAIELPLDYLWKQAAYFLALTQYLQDPNFDTDVYGKLLDRLERQAEGAKLSGSRGLSSQLPLGYDFGGTGDVPEPVTQVNSIRI